MPAALSPTGLPPITYKIPGTDLQYCPILTYHMLLSAYAIPGTDLDYRAIGLRPFTRCPVLT
eukprot:3935051-Rhodomonas_salina.4